MRSAECGMNSQEPGGQVRNAEWTHEFHEFSQIVRVTAAWGWAAPFGGARFKTHQYSSLTPLSYLTRKNGENANG
jgi:hypothetical protein